MQQLENISAQILQGTNKDKMGRKQEITFRKSVGENSCIEFNFLYFNIDRVVKEKGLGRTLSLIDHSPNKCTVTKDWKFDMYVGVHNIELQ